MENTPLVSVIIPAYNSADHISASLSSVFAQTFTDFEVILVNDGSSDTDRLKKVIQPFIQRVRYFEQDNLGPSAARNVGIRAARGEWIAFLDADDSWMPEFLTLQLQALQENPSLDLICSDSLVYGDSPSSGMGFLEMCPSEEPVTFGSLALSKSHLSTSSIVARKSVLIGAGLFDEGINRAEDYDLWLRLAFRGGKIGYQRKILIEHRCRPGSLSSDNLAMIAAATQVLQKLEHALPLRPETLALVRSAVRTNQAQLDLERGKEFLRRGDAKSAAEHLEKANAYFRRTKLRVILLGLRVAPSLTQWFVNNLMD